ncbi:MAG: hypothetical protein U1E65_34505 [Myxococcota bacterium]
MNVSGSSRLYFDSLTKLGLPPTVAKKLKEEVQKNASNDVDFFNYVPLSTLRTYGEKLQIPKTDLDRLFEALAPSTSPAISAKLDLTAFPKAQLANGPAKTYPAAPGGSLSPAELQPYKASLESLLKAPIPAEGLKASELQAILQKDAGKLRFHPSAANGLILSQIDQLKTLVASKSLPQHTEQDAEISLRSNRKLLVEKGGAKFFHQQGWSDFSLVRTTGKTPGTSGFVVHAFQKEKIVVTLPPDCSLILIDADGNERAGHLKPRKREIGGKVEDVVEIERNQVTPFGSRDHGKKSPFTVRILDKAGKPLTDQLLSFGEAPPPYSKEIAHGSFTYQSTSTSESERWTLDNGVPAGSSNKTPVGRRPAFSLDDGKVRGDRLVIEQDGERYPVSDLLQLLAPPKRTTQAFTVGAATYSLEPASIVSVDDNPENRLGATIRSSHNSSARSTSASSVTFDPSLFNTEQARWGIGGITITGTDGTVKGQFDPLDPGQDKNLRKPRA